MKDVILLYDDCCMYEIVILNYFMKCTNCEMVFCTCKESGRTEDSSGQTIRAMEGYSIHCDISLDEIDCSKVRSFIVPGGDISNIDHKNVLDMLNQLHDKKVIIAGICAGVDILDKAGVLKGVSSTHSSDLDCVRDKNIITARPNAYVDFAIEVGKALELFEDEADLQETIEFWKYHKRME